MTRIRVLDRPVSYPEGPTCHAGHLYFVEYARDVVAVLEPSGTTRTVYHEPGLGPAATALSLDGSLWVTGSDGNCILRISSEPAPFLRLLRDDSGRAFDAPNDLLFDHHGGLYFTASGVFDPSAPIAGAVFYRAAGGAVRQIAADIHYANGLALSPDDSTLFVSEHLQNRILAFDIENAGALNNRRVHADLHALAPTSTRDPLLGPDGLACRRDGALVVAQFAGGRLLVLGPDGRLARTVSLPFRHPTNVTFSEDDRLLYVTAFERNDPPYEGAVLEVDLSDEVP